MPIVFSPTNAPLSCFYTRFIVYLHTLYRAFTHTPFLKTISNQWLANQKKAVTLYKHIYLTHYAREADLWIN